MDRDTGDHALDDTPQRMVRDDSANRSNNQGPRPKTATPAAPVAVAARTGASGRMGVSDAGSSK